MATTVGVIHAIGVVAGPAEYLSSSIDTSSSMLKSKIDTEALLDSRIGGDSVRLKSRITL